MKHSFKLFGVLTLLFCLPLIGSAQTKCPNFGKKECLPKLKPYIPTEQTYTTTMLTGEKISIRMTFYYGDDNRVLICAEEDLGKIKLNLRNAANKVVFTTESYGTIQWDFNVENTQDMTLEIITQELKTGGMDKAGCVTVYVGFR